METPSPCPETASEYDTYLCMRRGIREWTPNPHESDLMEDMANLINIGIALLIIGIFVLILMSLRDGRTSNGKRRGNHRKHRKGAR